MFAQLTLNDAFAFLQKWLFWTNQAKLAWKFIVFFNNSGMQEIKELKRHFMEERRGYLSTFRSKTKIKYIFMLLNIFDMLVLIANEFVDILEQENPQTSFTRSHLE